MSVRILLVDDHHVVRAGFREILEEQPDFEVIGETDNGNDAKNLARELSPDVILMDIDLRGSELTGVQASRQILAHDDSINIIALSVYADAQHVKAMLAAGCKGYLSKACTDEEMVEAVTTVMTGENYFNEEILAVIQDAYVQQIQNPVVGNADDLTRRETEILRQVALGENSKSIGDKLDISSKTVDAHKRKIMEKLKLYSVADLTKYAIRKGIIHPDE